METQMTTSELNIFEKLKWKIKYRNLDKICGKNVRFMRALLKDTNVQQQYEKNKQEILTILKRTQKEVPEKLEDVVGSVVSALSYGENSVTSSLSDTLSNIDVMLNIKGFGGKASDYIVNQVTEQDLTTLGFSTKLMQLNKLNGYDENTIKRYPFEVLEKILTVPETDLRSIPDAVSSNIKNAVKNNIPANEIHNYIKLIKTSSIQPYDENGYFLSKNMQFSSFFLEYSEKYKTLPYKVEEYFSDTRDMNIKEKMIEMGKTPEFYQELRDKWIDLQIENTTTLDVKKSLIEKKFFNMTYDDIQRITQEGKEDTFSKDTQSMLKAIKQIQNIKDINQLMEIKAKLETIKDTINVGKAFDEVYNFYATDILKGIFKVEEFSGEKSIIKYKDKDINVLHLTGEEYKGIIHCIDNRAPGGKNAWNQKERESNPLFKNPRLFTTIQQGSSGISSSIETDDNMSFYTMTPDALYVGLELEPENILGFYAGDGATSVNNTNYVKEIANVRNQVTKAEDAFFSDRYNELYSSRYKETDNTIDLINKENRVEPKYILTFKRTTSYVLPFLPSINYGDLQEDSTKRILDFASEYNIPIVEVDQEKYKDKFQKRRDETKKKILEGNEKINEEDIYNLAKYERSIALFSNEAYNKKGPEFLLMDILPNLNLTENNANAINNVIKACDMHEEDWDKHIITARFSEEEKDTKIHVSNTINTIREQLKEMLNDNNKSEQEVSLPYRE